MLRKILKFIVFPVSIAISLHCTSCSDNDEPENPGNAYNVTINANGTTSNGVQFTPVSDNSFYLDYVLYKIVDSHLEVVGRDDTEIKEDVNIYAKVNYLGTQYNTRKIADKAFSECKKITNVHIPDGIAIGDDAFAYCNNLKSVRLPQDINIISYALFGSCTSLENISIPESVSIIKGEAFNYCKNLKNISIPESVRTIGYDAFCRCENLKNITIPAFCKVYSSFYYSEIEHLFINKGAELINVIQYSYNGAFSSSTIKELQIDGMISYHKFSFYNTKISLAKINSKYWTKTQIDELFKYATVGKIEFY